MRKDQYRHVAIPKPYWLVLMAILPISLALVLTAIVISLNQGNPLIDEGTTLFEQITGIAFILVLLGGVMISLCFLIFPASIKSKDDPNFKKWPPWANN